jgi:hypothetical protein
VTWHSSEPGQLLGGRSDARRPAAVIGLVVLALTAVVAAVLVRPGESRTVSTPFLTYTAPVGWTADPPQDPAAPADPSALTGIVRGPAYPCGDETHVRGFAAAALLPTGPSAGAGPPDRAERLVRWFAATSYGTADGRAPTVTVAPPRPVRVTGPDGPVDATVTEAIVHVGSGRCAASRGTVLVLAAPSAGGAALLLVAGDAEGGPPVPAPPDRATLDAVLGSVRLGAG